MLLCFVTRFFLLKTRSDLSIQAASLEEAELAAIEYVYVSLAHPQLTVLFLSWLIVIVGRAMGKLQDAMLLSA